MKPLSVFVLIGLVIIGISIAGCTSSTTVNSTVDKSATTVNTAAPTNTATPINTAAPTNTATPINTATPTNTATPINTATPTKTATPTTVSVVPMQVVIDYSGTWQGSITNGGNIRTIDGSGTATFDISSPIFPVSVTVQKKDESGQMLTVKILQNGVIIKTESTLAAHGSVLATVSA